MTKEAKTQVTVQVGIEALWKSLAKDFRFVIAKIMPNIFKEVELIEGDGNLDVSTVSHQKEKIAELDESLHQIGLEVVEGGHLNIGFSSYKTTFQLTVGESKTLVDVKVVYDTETKTETGMPEKTLKSALAFMECLQNYLLNQGL